MRGTSLVATAGGSLLRHALIIALHAAAALAFGQVLTGPAWVATCIALAAAGVAAILNGRRWEQCRWVFAARGELRLCIAGGEHLLRPQGSATDFGWAIWLHWRDASSGRPGACMLLRDQFDADTWRGIRIWLRQLAVIEPPASSQHPNA